MTAPRERQNDSATHPGIRIDRIPVSGVAGLVFVGASVAIFLIGVPLTRWFLAFAIPVGILVAVILHFTARDR